MNKTKTTALINKVHADGSVRRSVVSSTEWSAVARRNKKIPADQRRYFIVDYIAERDRIDRMVILHREDHEEPQLDHGKGVRG